MENLSHSFSRKKSYTNNVALPANSSVGGGGGKSMYDDVFGGQPKFGLTSLAPRLQDYTEIFGGFHSSRGSSSIPVLDLPNVDEDGDVDGDVRSSGFDYSEVFGGINGVGFAVSFEDLVNEANGGYDSSDEAWSPDDSESLSGETDPSACSERSRSFPDADILQSVNDITQFSVSYNKVHQRSNEDISNGMAHVARLHAIPGYACVVDEASVPQKVDCEKRPYQVADDLNYCQESGERFVVEKRFSKSMSLPMKTGFRRHGSSKSGPITRAPFVTVSDISLRTKPSQLPPPSRPPPVLAVRKCESGTQHSKLKASKSFDFERIAGDNLSPFFDMKLDECSSASTMEDALKKTQSKLESREVVMDGRKEGIQSCQKLQVEDMNLMEQILEKTSNTHNDFAGDRLQETWAKEAGGVVTSAEERKTATKTGERVAHGIDREVDADLFRKSAGRTHRRTYTSPVLSYKSEETVAWREAADYFEVETDNSWMLSSEQVKAKNISKVAMESRVKPVAESFEQEENSNKVKVAKEASKWEVNHNQPEVAESPSQWIGGEQGPRTAEGSCDQPENQTNGPVDESVHALETNGETLHGAKQHEVIEKTLCKDKNVKKLKGETPDSNQSESEQGTEATTEKRMKKKNVTDANSRQWHEMMPKEVPQVKPCGKGNKDIIEEVDFEEEKEEILEQGQKEIQQKEFWGRQDKKKIQKEAFEIKENERRPRKLLESKDEKRLGDITQHGGSEKIRKMHLAEEVYQKEHYLTLSSEEMPRNPFKQDEIEKELEDQDTGKIQQVKAHDWDRNEERPSHASRRKDYEMRQDGTVEQESDKNASTVSFEEEPTKKQFEQANGHGSNSAGEHEESSRMSENKEHIEKIIGTDWRNSKMFDNTFELSSESLFASHVFVKNDASETLPCESNSKLKFEIKEESGDQLPNLQFKEIFNSLHEDQGSLQNEEHETRAVGVNGLTAEQEHLIKPKQVITGSNGPLTRQVKVVSHPSDPENKMVIPPDSQGVAEVGGGQVTVSKDVEGEKFTTHQVVRDWVDNAKKIGDALQAVLEDIGEVADTDETATTQVTETKKKNTYGIPLPQEPKVERRLEKDRKTEHAHFWKTEEERERQREREKDMMAETQRVGEKSKKRELENEVLKRIEEEREREREREKDRMAVDSAIREARERTYADARERAERAAVERASAEVRQRAMAEARERLERASTEARETRIRAERAAVERATAEARQRAFGKVTAEKPRHEPRFGAGSVDKIRNMDIQFQSTGNSGGSRFTYSSANAGLEGESPQRCKARLERYQRTAERAAKALAEKNMRDLVAQREQDERNRLAEILDAEVRRWSSGKEGNLRALLSTLQYILGPDSGWQPIPLTEVITSAAVKRAYRKATLCVHPDKLQQRGASIQQKYICEKVFDLLKDAWNKFNSEER